MAGLLLVVLIIGLGFVGVRQFFPAQAPSPPITPEAAPDLPDSVPSPPTAPVELIRQPNQIRENLGGTLETQSSQQVEQLEGL